MTSPRAGLACAVRIGCIAAVTIALAATGLTPVNAATPPAPAAPVAEHKVILVAQPGRLPAAQAEVTALGGKITRNLALVNGLSAVVPAGAVKALGADRTLIRSITPDAGIQVASFGADTPAPVASDPPSPEPVAPDPAATTPVAPVPPGTDPAAAEPTSVYPQALGADTVWQAGDKGEGVTVAVIDTGVTPSQDLSGRMVPVAGGLFSPAAPCENLSGEATCADSYGHGSFVGGVIAGDGSASAGTYAGVAPKAKLLAVKVAGASGATDVSNVLAAIQWVVSYRSKYNIRVLNLSLSTDSTQTYRTDPFNYAVERAWDAGIVVVVSASNRGPGAGTISKPGDDPLVITVGAEDDRGTPGLDDDELPDFSSHGPTVPDGLSKPDLIAPGSHLMSLRSVGSMIDRSFPESITGDYHRGSGTSFAAAATSGVVALMLSRHPEMTPNQVKYALTQTARAVPASSDPQAVGAGLVDAAAAVLNPPAGSANAGVVRSNGTGLLSLSRGHVSVETTTVPNTLVNGGLTTQLLLWDPTGFLLGWTQLGWLVSTWALTPLLPVRWNADADWPGRNWGGRNWGGGDWQGATWEGDPVKRDYGEPTDGALWFGAWG